MSNEKLSWLIEIKDYLYNKGGRDLYDIVYATLLNDKMGYKSFLKMASEGYGYTPSEGFGYALEQDWVIPEEFDEVTFFLGEYETSSISPDEFFNLIKCITDAYDKNHPSDRMITEKYIEQLSERYGI